MSRFDDWNPEDVTVGQEAMKGRYFVVQSEGQDQLVRVLSRSRQGPGLWNCEVVLAGGNRQRTPRVLPGVYLKSCREVQAMDDLAAWEAAL